jgi:hypothetical protein
MQQQQAEQVIARSLRGVLFSKLHMCRFSGFRKLCPLLTLLCRCLCIAAALLLHLQETAGNMLEGLHVALEHPAVSTDPRLL